MLVLPAHYVIERTKRLWRHVEAAGDGVLGGISNGIGQIAARFPNALPNLQSASDLFVVSDYSGPRSNSSAKYETFTYLIFSYPDTQRWRSERLAVRETYLHQRSMSFKALNDGVRRSALPRFLAASNSIPGILVTIAVTKNRASLFQSGTRLDMSMGDFANFRHWKPRAFEKVLRAVHFLSFLVAGLSVEGQSVIWYSDEDDIAPNAGRDDRTRTAELGKIFTTVVSHYVPHKIPEVVIGTEKDDDPSRSLADLIAIPDLACGAWCEFLSLVPASEFVNGTPAVGAALEQLSRRASQILSWFAEEHHPLKRLLCVVGEALPDHKVSYICSAAATLQQFKEQVEATMQQATPA